MLQLIQECLLDLAQLLGLIDQLLYIFVLFVIIDVFIDYFVAVPFGIILYLCYASLSLHLHRDQMILHLGQCCFFPDDSAL